MARAADLILLLHFAWVLTILVPIPLIVLGSYRGWRWIRNRTFRLIHLLMIGIVVLESLFGMICPLTLWEDLLRNTAGQTPYGASFVEYWIARILFYDFPPWVFTTLYVAVALTILALYWRIPPARKN